MFLQPWKGENYHLGINNEKILILGESHYDDDEFGEGTDLESDYTIKVLDQILREKEYFRFFHHVGQLFDEDWSKVWSNVAFANLIQYVLKKGEQPTSPQIESITSFYKYLNILQPDKAIVCSSRAWSDWFPKYIDNREGVEKNDSFRLGKSYVFRYPRNGGYTKVIAINHSSSREPDYISTWKPVVESFLNYKE